MRFAAVLLLLIGLPASADVSRLSWLAGCWAYDDEAPGSGEYWMPPAGGTMFAISRTIHDSRTIAFEYLRIEGQSGGQLKAIDFPMSRIECESFGQ